MADELRPEYDDLDAIGNTGLRQYGGFIDEEFLRQLRGRRGVETYREMGDNDPIVGAVLYVITTLVQQVEWKIEPADESEAAQAEAEWLETALEDMSHTWEELLDEVLSMLLYGWSYFECVYKIRRGPDEEDPKYRSKYDDGRFGWRKIELRSQDSLYRWEFDPEDQGLRGMWQLADSALESSGAPAFIPIERALLFRHRTFKRNPEGKSLFRNGVRPWFYLKRIQEIEAIGIERDAAGTLMFEVPPELMSKNASADQKALRELFERVGQQFRRGERDCLIMPAGQVQGVNGQAVTTGYKASLLQSAGKRQIDINEVVMRYETRILMCALAEFLMNGTDERTGSRSLVSSKTTTFAMALGALLKKVASVFNRFAIPRLMTLNGVPPELWPRLEHGDIETPPLEEVAAYVTALANAGFLLTPNQPLERRLLSYAKLPPPEDGQATADLQPIVPTREPGTTQPRVRGAPTGAQQPPTEEVEP